MRLFFSMYFFFSTGFSFAVSEEKKEFSALNLKKLKIDMVSGHIKISQSKDEKVSITSRKEFSGENCDFNMRRNKKNLIIRVKNEGWFNNDVCKVDFEIQVPKSISLKIKNGVGNLDIVGTQGDLDFEIGSGHIKVLSDLDEVEGELGSGSIEMEGVISDTELEVGSGPVKLSGLTGDADIEVGSGDVVLMYNHPTKKSKLDVNLGSGHVTAYFPPSMQIKTDIESNVSIQNEFVDDKKADFKVSADIGSGDLKMKKITSKKM